MISSLTVDRKSVQIITIWQSQCRSSLLSFISYCNHVLESHLAFGTLALTVTIIRLCYKNVIWIIKERPLTRSLLCFHMNCLGFVHFDLLICFKLLPLFWKLSFVIFPYSESAFVVFIFMSLQSCLFLQNNEKHIFYYISGC